VLITVIIVGRDPNLSHKYSVESVRGMDVLFAMVSILVCTEWARLRWLPEGR